MKMTERTDVKVACPGDVVDVALERQCAVQFDTERLQCSCHLDLTSSDIESVVASSCRVIAGHRRKQPQTYPDSKADRFARTKAGVRLNNAQVDREPSAVMTSVQYKVECRPHTL